MSLARTITEDVLNFLKEHDSGAGSEIAFLKEESEADFTKLQDELENRVQSHLDSAQTAGTTVPTDTTSGDPLGQTTAGAEIKQGPPADQEQPQPAASEESPPQG